MNKEIISLGKDSIIYGIGSGITRFIGIFTLPLFTTYLTPEDYGVLAMLAMLSMVVQPVFSLGLSTAMGPSYFAHNNIVNRSQVVWSVFAVNAASAFLLILIAWSFPVSLGALVRLTGEYSFLVGLSLTGTALTILAASFAQRVQFEKQAKLYVIVTLVTALSAIIVSIIAVVFMGWGVMGIVCGQVVGNAITFAAFFFVGVIETVPIICKNLIKELLRLGLPLVPSFAFLFVLMHANKYILEWQFGLHAVGVYSIGYNIGMTISLVTNGIATAWYPFFMGYMNSQDQAKDIFKKIMTYYFVFVGFLCVCFFIFAKPVIYIVTQNQFYDSYKVVGFVALTNFILMVFNFFLPVLYYQKKVQYVSVIQGVSALISLPVSYFLIEKWSILGAAIGLFVGNVSMVVFLYALNIFCYKKYLYVEYEWKNLLTIITAYASVVAFNAFFCFVFVDYEFIISVIFIILSMFFAILQVNKLNFVQYLTILCKKMRQ